MTKFQNSFTGSFNSKYAIHSSHLRYQRNAVLQSLCINPSDNVFVSPVADPQIWNKGRVKAWDGVWGGAVAPPRKFYAKLMCFRAKCSLVLRYIQSMEGLDPPLGSPWPEFWHACMEAMCENSNNVVTQHHLSAKQVWGFSGMSQGNESTILGCGGRHLLWILY